VASCGAITAKGGRCSATVRPGAEWCYNHDPARAAERRRNASKAAKSKPSRELSDIKRLLSELTSRVLGEEGFAPLETGPAAVANQLINTRLRAVELERKIREQEELTERLEALESVLKVRSIG
jgi:hypothetical protein